MKWMKERTSEKEKSQISDSERNEIKKEKKITAAKATTATTDKVVYYAGTHNYVGVIDCALTHYIIHGWV